MLVTSATSHDTSKETGSFLLGIGKERLSSEKRAQNGCLEVFFGDDILPSHIGVTINFTMK